MRLERLSTRGFRNLAPQDLAIPEAGLVAVGENGQGKTNLLEAMYYLVLFRSLRGARDAELVRFGEPGFFVSGETNGSGAGAAVRRVAVGYEAAARKKKVTLDRLEPARLSDAVGNILAVPFSPADVAIVAGAPSARRRYLDVLLSVSQRSYLLRLTELRAVLKQRNAALRRGRAHEARAFDAAFSAAAAHVAAARQRWVEHWADRFAQFCTALGERRGVQVKYHGHTAGDACESWQRELSNVLERDLRRGATTVGPHRDDLKLTLGGRDLRIFGSAGQQRTAAIGLRLIEAETLTAVHGSPPVALYDDVFAELDENRQACLLELIGEILPGQAIVTAPRDTEVPAALFDRPRWQVREGRIEAFDG